MKVSKFKLQELILGVCLIVTIIIGCKSTSKTLGVIKSNSVDYLIRPDYSRGYVAWKNPVDKIQINTWQIKILRRTITGKYDTLIQFEQKKNFFRLDAKFRNDRSIYVKVTGLNAASVPVSVGNLLQVAPNGDFDPLCPPPGCGAITAKWTCNGTDYAWTIEKIEEYGNSGAYRLSLSSGGAWWDNSLGIGVPYYAYAYPNSPLGKLADNNITYEDGVTVDDQYRDISGALLTSDNSPTGKVLRIQKDAEEFDGPEWNTPILTADAGFNNSTSLNMVISRFNTYAHPCNPCNYTRPYLSCTPAVGQSSGGGYTSGPWWDDIPDSLLNVLVDCGNGFFDWDNGINNPCERITQGGGNGVLDNIFYSLANIDKKYNSKIGSTIYSVDNFRKFNIRRIDKDIVSIVIDPKKVFLTDGRIKYPKINLQEGLYSFEISFSGKTSHLPIAFEIRNQN